MKCPLFVMGFIARYGDLKDVRLDCLQKECAWWITASDECAILSLALSLGFIMLRVGNVAKELTMLRPK